MEKNSLYYIELYKETFGVSFPRGFLQRKEESLIEMIKKCLREGKPLDFDKNPRCYY